MSELKPIRILPARERVVPMIRAAIISGEFKEGQFLTLDMISKQVGMSHTPVREAFQILEQEGLITLTPNRGAMVKGVTEEFLREHYEVRKLLEGEAAARSCRPDADISEIEEAYCACAAAKERRDLAAYDQLNDRFHEAIWDAAGNRKLKRLLAQLWNGFSLDRTITLEQYFEHPLIGHKSLMEAIRNRDGEAARSAMQFHVEENFRQELANWRNR